MKFVIVGLGSIGKRHRKNLESLGHKVIPCHRDDNLKQLLIQEKPDGALICNPTSLHLETAIVVAEAGVNVFLEKPISHKPEGVDKLLRLVKEKKIVLLVGYNLRWQPGLVEIKEELNNQTIGKVKTAKIEAGSYLPSWHPNEDHRQSYSAKKELGGGVLLDLSHEIDYAVWFFGKARKVKAVVKMEPELEIETEALADFEVEFKSGVKAKIHLDYLQKKYKRSCRVIGEKGELNWDYRAYQAEDLDDTYVNELKNFIEAIKGNEKPKVSGEEAKHVLEIVEAAKKSSKSGKVIDL